MKQSDIKEEGLYLCRVTGLKHLDYAILKYDGSYWWQYIRAAGWEIEGWCGIMGDNVEIVDVLQKIE